MLTVIWRCIFRRPLSTKEVPAICRAVTLSGTHAHSLCPKTGTTRWPINYDAIIGLWQTVWLEPVMRVHVTSSWPSYPVGARTLQVNARLSPLATGELQVDLCHEGRVMQQVQVAFTSRSGAL